MNTEIDFIVFNYSIILNANPSQGWQLAMREFAHTLINFLYDNHLLIDIYPFDEQREIRKDLKIYRSNLTDDGLEMFKSIVPKWERAIGRGTAISKTTILEKGLQKIRENKN